MSDGQPWIRSPQAVTPEGGITFYAEIWLGHVNQTLTGVVFS